MFDYIIICVETANENSSSICQLGFASVKHGKIVGRFSRKIIPDDDFDPFFSRIHGIGPELPNGAIEFSVLFNEISDLLEGQFVVTPSIFDRISFLKATKKNNLVCPTIKWLDLTRLAKKTWPELHQSGYTLGSILGHASLEKLQRGSSQTASVVVNIIQKALENSAKSFPEWIDSIEPLTPSTTEQHPNENMLKFDGEEIVFEGSFLLSIDVYSNYAKEMGFHISSSLTPATTLLCVGIKHLSLTSNNNDLPNLTDAARRIQEGQLIRIIDEDDLWDVIYEQPDERIREFNELRNIARLDLRDDATKSDIKYTSEKIQNSDTVSKEEINNKIVDDLDISDAVTKIEKQHTPLKLYSIVFLLVFSITATIAYLLFDANPTATPAAQTVNDPFKAPATIITPIAPKASASSGSEIIPSKKGNQKPKIKLRQ